MTMYRIDPKRLAILICFGVFVSTIRLSGQPAIPQPNWDGWKFLIGEWVGEGGGDPGQGSGGFTYGFDLEKRILVRKNFADYPATKDRPAFRHDDLMIVWQDPGKAIRAEYFDNEGHVVHYSVEFSKDSNSVVFVSDPSPSAPRFRLTNTKTGPKTIAITFEIALPGKPEEFSPYITASARKKQ